eukprot:s7_g79.t1
MFWCHKCGSGYCLQCRYDGETCNHSIAHYSVDTDPNFLPDSIASANSCFKLKELFDNTLKESRYFGYDASEQAAFRQDTIDDLYARARAGDKVGGKLMMTFLAEGVREFKVASEYSYVPANGRVPTMAEHYVEQQLDDMPVPIYRPQIMINAKDFYPITEEEQYELLDIYRHALASYQEGCERWVHFLTAAIAAQMDFITGDGNLFAQRNFKQDSHTDYKSCILVDLLERLLSEINRNRSGMNQVSLTRSDSHKAAADGVVSLDDSLTTGNMSAAIMIGPWSGARYRGQDTGARRSGTFESTARVPVAPPKTPPIPPPRSRRRERSHTPTGRNTQRSASTPQQRPQSPRPPPQRSWHQQQRYEYQRYNQPYTRHTPRAAAPAPPNIPQPPPPPPAPVYRPAPV